MDSKDDLVVGVFDNHTWEDIEPWVVSLDTCGYLGKKAVIVYNAQKSIVDKLVSRGYQIFCFGSDAEGNIVCPNIQSVVVERFLHLWYFLKSLKGVRYIVTTDVKDVVFQLNLSELLDDFSYYPASDYGIFVQGEGLTYEEEPWSRNNMKASFGDEIYETIKDNEIFCAGLIVGRFKYFIDLCLQISLTCRGVPMNSPGGGGPDQSALNVILNQGVWQEVLNSSPNWCWGVHLGTTKPALEVANNDAGIAYRRGDLKRPRLDDPYIEDGKVYLKKHVPYYIIHQYNKIPEWDKIIREKYSEEKTLH